MSYRDLRNFTEMIRSLGFVRLVSMENFRTPNFNLVADILIWLIKRFDPEANIHEEYTSEQDRVLLVRSAAEFMALRANLILNTKRLYQADGFSVKELLKIATLLYQAQQANIDDEQNLNRPATDMIDINSHIEELKLSRELATQVTTKGASIYESLGKEVELKEERYQSVSNFLELNKVEKALKETNFATKQNIESTKGFIENVAATENSLDSKIEKKKSELERNQKRLQTLKKVRPAFLEEFEKLEVDLQMLYKDYINKTRCLCYLEQVQEENAIAEQERMFKRQRETRKMMEELQLEDARKLMEDDESLDVLADNVPQKAVGRLRTATAARARLATGRKKVYGGMNADDDSNSLDSDSEFFLDDVDGEDSSILGSNDDLKGIASESKSDQSDDDF
ncbi:unnamed protein product [Nezara viridula]|uniref:Clusterin-associated protein 1 n=1 Tax=Nezara viridula TaxID=85310 RepID=A0A9P0E4E7_NEZVI|nr:unnamed protein product [Nezara viridula]